MEAAEKKTRAKAEYVVETVRPIPGDSNVLAWTSASEQHPTHDNAAKAEKWIRDNGKDGNEYRVIRVVSGPFKLAIEKVEKRKLV